eukprot:1412644-Prymnesium_polylepis.1
MRPRLPTEASHSRSFDCQPPAGRVRWSLRREFRVRSTWGKRSWGWHHSQMSSRREAVTLTS